MHGTRQTTRSLSSGRRGQPIPGRLSQRPASESGVELAEPAAPIQTSTAAGRPIVTRLARPANHSTGGRGERARGGARQAAGGRGRGERRGRGSGVRLPGRPCVRWPVPGVAVTRFLPPQAGRQGQAAWSSPGFTTCRPASNPCPRNRESRLSPQNPVALGKGPCRSAGLPSSTSLTAEDAPGNRRRFYCHRVSVWERPALRQETCRSG